MTLAFRWIGLLALAAMVGCGGSKRPEPKRYAVQGTVTLDGQPLDGGVVYFKTPETGAFESFEVKAGKFEGKAEAGKRRVEVNAFREESVQSGEMKVENKKNLVPPQFNLQSTLTADVTEAGPNEFSFAVTSKK